MSEQKEIETYTGNDVITRRKLVEDSDDIFAMPISKSIAGLSPQFKRKAARMEKASNVQTSTQYATQNRWYGAGEFNDVPTYAGPKNKPHSKQIEIEALNGYFLFDVVIPQYNFDYLAKLYELSPAHYAAVRAKASNIVGLGYDFVTTDKVAQAQSKADTVDSKKKVTDKVSRAKQQMFTWLDSCNETEDFADIMRMVWTDYETTGNGYLEIGRTVAGEIGYIGHVPSIAIRVRRHRDGFVQIIADKVVFFRNLGGKALDPLGNDPRPNELIHFKKYSPRTTFYGVPDIVSASKAIAGNEFAARFNLDYFENKAVPRYVIIVKGANLSNRSQQEIIEFFETGLKGKHHRTIYVPLPADEPDHKVSFEMKPVEAGIQDSSFTNYHDMNMNDILMAHGVPISIVNIGGTNVSLASAAGANKAFKEGICQPEQKMAENRINRFVKEKTDMFLFKFSELSLTDADAQSQIDERSIRNQTVVPNEVRAKQGLPPLEGGDKVVDLKGPVAAQAKINTNGNSARAQARTANSPDKSGTARNPKGEGPVTP